MSRERPLVTIATPTYNRAQKTLRQSLESALAQTYPNLEIIVSDNASTDDTADVVASYADPRIRYVRHAENRGSNDNLNFCIDSARGAYLLLLHDDDVLDPDFVETCMDAVCDSTSVGIVRTGMRIIDSHGRVLGHYPNEIDGRRMVDLLTAWYRSRITPYCCNTIWNVAVLREVGGFHSRHNLFQDVLAQMKVIARAGFVNVPRVKSSWRRHDDNVGSAGRILAWCEDSLDIYRTINELAPEQSDALREEGKRFLCRVNYGYVAGLPSPRERLWTYLKVARAFDYAYPPLKYAWEKDFRPRLRALTRRLLRRAPTTAPAA